jgi:hypothetical protein
VAAGLPAIESACRQASSRVLIATPFLSNDVAAYVARACEAGHAKRRRLIVAANLAAIEDGYLSPQGVRRLADSGFVIKSLLNLHAKTVLVDGRWGLVSSGNLTAAGTNNGNAELGVSLTPQQVKHAEAFFREWWSAAEPLDLDWLLRFGSPTRGALNRRRRRQRAGQGGRWNADPPIDLRRHTAFPRDSGYWLKVVYASSSLLATEWSSDGWVWDRHDVRDARPLHKPTYRVGDHLVVYVTKGPIRACPAVLRVTRPPVFDPDLVEREGAPGDAEKWGWVTRVETIEAVDLREAPTLDDIGVPAASVRQHGHIHISEAQYAAARTLIARARRRAHHSP